ncbi:DUF1707 domain-containing protein [Terrabacter sp. NPDC080008]|uniref:DUF1707 SHOCT-like domain-containing protein n=1 Tax=Terrabacter sp. NPDC080008 TaxID=3155176 RepID=UPI00344E7503
MDDGDIRISNTEREEALSALAEHRAAGRLDADEYEDRRGRATDALVRREITELFVDLPEPHPHLGSSVTTPAPAPSDRQDVVDAPTSTRAKWARTLVSLSPFIALAIFFRTGQWLAFLLVPVMAILAKTLDD